MSRHVFTIPANFFHAALYVLGVYVHVFRVDLVLNGNFYLTKGRAKYRIIRMKPQVKYHLFLALLLLLASPAARSRTSAFHEDGILVDRPRRTGAGFGGFLHVRPLLKLLHKTLLYARLLAIPIFPLLLGRSLQFLRFLAENAVHVHFVCGLEDSLTPAGRKCVGLYPSEP